MHYRHKGRPYADSRVTWDEMGLEYPAAKIVRCKNGDLAGAAGHAGDCQRFMEWADNGFKGHEPKWKSTGNGDDVLGGLVVRKSGIFVFSRGCPLEEVILPYFAIGSGGKPARVAMLLGKTPEEAMELAYQVDPGSGGEIQILRLNANSRDG